MPDLLLFALLTLAALLAMAGGLHLLPRLGSLGRAAADACCRAPTLDWVVAYFTTLPQIAGIVFGAVALEGPLGWLWGLLVAIGAQVLCVLVWTPLHELAHRDAVRGPRIVKSLNARVGRTRNHAAVWITALAVPVFTLIRIAECVVYPPLTWLIRLPRYRSGDWVNVSRQKFRGLVGHDLIWCLYCDWMTGVWSLGSEMLRNVESFWCPIRFYSDKKCANCAVDFPDIDGGWAPSTGTMADVADVIASKYPGPDGVNAWFGHPVRLTVEGRERQEATERRGDEAT